MKEKALILIGMHSKKWLAKQMGINHLTLEKRLSLNEWKVSEVSRLEELYNREKTNL
jgi:hypothetical protein